MVSSKSRDGIKSAGFVFMAKARTRGRITMVKKEEGGEEKNGCNNRIKCVMLTATFNGPFNILITKYMYTMNSYDDIICKYL